MHYKTSQHLIKARQLSSVPAVGLPEGAEPAGEGGAVDDVQRGGGGVVGRQAERVDRGVGGRQVRQLPGPAAEAAVRVLTPANEAIEFILD